MQLGLSFPNQPLVVLLLTLLELLPLFLPSAYRFLLFQQARVGGVATIKAFLAVP
jgi:hypothetical protein